MDFARHASEPAVRIAGWIALLALALLGHWLGSAVLRAACVPALLLLLAAGLPRALRPLPLACAALAAAAIAIGAGEPLLDATPALVAALVGALFARTLRRGREPLIARAIVAIDGREPLADAAVARYARTLTAVWAVYQFALAALALVLALRGWMLPQYASALPGARVFGTVVLPLAVLALALGEFALRPRLLPQAPRRSLGAFARALVRSWPALMKD